MELIVVSESESRGSGSGGSSTGSSGLARAEICVYARARGRNGNPVEEGKLAPKRKGDQTSAVSERSQDDNSEMSVSEPGNVKKRRSSVVIPEYVKILKENPIMYECSICTRKFRTKRNVKYHEFCQCGRQKPFKCEQCGQEFISKYHYQYHLRTHTGERPHACPTCGKRFYEKSKLTRHMLTHTGEKLFHCDICGRGFVTSKGKKSHILKHTGERPFSCGECRMQFTCLTNLKQHLLSHTGEKPFTCTECGKSFALKWILKNHLKTHSRDHPHVCDQCSRSFKSLKDLKRHAAIHTGEKLLKCVLCGRSIARKDNLQRHLRQVHNQQKENAKQLATQTPTAETSSETGSTGSVISDGATAIVSTSAAAPNEARTITMITPVFVLSQAVTLTPAFRGQPTRCLSFEPTKTEPVDSAPETAQASQGGASAAAVSTEPRVDVDQMELEAETVEGTEKTTEEAGPTDYMAVSAGALDVLELDESSLSSDGTIPSSSWSLTAVTPTSSVSTSDSDNELAAVAVVAALNMEIDSLDLASSTDMHTEVADTDNETRSATSQNEDVESEPSELTDLCVELVTAEFSGNSDADVLSFDERISAVAASSSATWSGSLIPEVAVTAASCAAFGNESAISAIAMAMDLKNESLDFPNRKEEATGMKPGTSQAHAQDYDNQDVESSASTSTDFGTCMDIEVGAENEAIMETARRTATATAFTVDLGEILDEEERESGIGRLDIGSGNEENREGTAAGTETENIEEAAEASAVMDIQERAPVLAPRQEHIIFARLNRFVIILVILRYLASWLFVGRGPRFGRR